MSTSTFLHLDRAEESQQAEIPDPRSDHDAAPSWEDVDSEQDAISLET